MLPLSQECSQADRRLLLGLSHLMEGKAEEFGFTNKETSHGGTCLLFQLKQSGPKSLSNDIKIKGGAGKDSQVSRAL